MRILYVSTPSFADCDIPLLKAFGRMGHEVFYFLKIAPYSLRATLVDITKQYGRSGIFDFSIYPELDWMVEAISPCHCFVMNDIRGKVCCETMALYRSLENRISEINPDVIQFVGDPDILPMPVFAKFRKKIVMTVHDPLPHSGEARRRSEFFRRIAFKLCRRIILLNDIQADAFADTYGVPRGKISFASLGLYGVLHRRRASGLDAKSAGSSGYVLFFGRISPYKGLEYLLPAFERVHDELPSVRLVVAGAGDYYFDYDRYKDCGYIDFIHHYVSGQELTTLIRNASFVVCPYSDATQSGVVSTVLPVGTPMVVTDVGTMPVMIRKYDAGSVVPAKDEDALFKAMAGLLSDTSLLKMKRNNLAMALEKADGEWDDIAGNYIAAYMK